MSEQAFGRLIPRDRLGTGSFATVWRCEDPELGGEVAVKVLAQEHSSDPRIRDRFVQEAQLLRRTDGQGRIVAVHDVGRTEDDRPFMVMEFAAAGTLEDRVPDDALDPEAIAQLVGSLHHCLRVLHANGIVHRDLKPSNLLVTSQPAVGADGPLLRADERLVVGDLGLAKAMESDWEGEVLGGTPAYMAPEQRRAGRIDARADLYAATAIVARAASGRRPAPAEEGVAPSVELPDTYPRAFRAALEAGMSHDPDERPADADEWSELLLGGLAGTGRGRRVPLPAVLAVVAVAFVVVAVVVLVAGGGSDAELAAEGNAVVGAPLTIVAADGIDVDRWVVEPAWATSREPEGPAGNEFTIQPIYPRPLTVVAVDATDGEPHELVVRPDPSPDAPAITGPERVALLEPAEFEAGAPCDDVQWSVETADGLQQPLTGCSYGFNADRVGRVFVLASRVVDGREVGSSLGVDIRAG